jgi:hypothetical protein
MHFDLRQHLPPPELAERAVMWQQGTLVEVGQKMWDQVRTESTGQRPFELLLLEFLMLDTEGDDGCSRFEILRVIFALIL